MAHESFLKVTKHDIEALKRMPNESRHNGAGLSTVLAAGGAIAYLTYKCRDKTPEELRTSAKVYATQCLAEIQPYASNASQYSTEALNKGYVALMQYLYLKELKQETDELQQHQMEVLEALPEETPAEPVPVL